MAWIANLAKLIKESQAIEMQPIWIGHICYYDKRNSINFENFKLNWQNILIINDIIKRNIVLLELISFAI